MWDGQIKSNKIMNKVKFNFLLIALVAFSICIVGSACSKHKEISNNEFDLIATNQSFALFLIDIDGKKESKEIENIIKVHNPQVTILGNSTWNLSQDDDFITKIAYNNSMDGQRLQGYFSATTNNGNTKQGTGFFVTNTFSNIKKIVLENNLILHLMDYNLDNSKNITIISCTLDKGNTSLAVEQAKSLASYSNNIDNYDLLVVTIDDNEEAAGILSMPYKQLCDIESLKQGDNKSQYVYSSKTSSWGIKYGLIIDDNAISKSDGLLLRIGLK